MKYVVEGGIYTDTTFTIVTTPPEMYFFDNYQDAHKKWWELACKNVDICEHRIFIRELKDDDQK